MKNTRTIFFSLAMILFIAVPLYMIWRYENVHSRGEIFRFKSEPVDPYDAFRGKYINLSFRGFNSILFPDTSKKFSVGQTVYLEVQKDDSGFAYISKTFSEPPSHHHYIETKVSYAYDSDFSVDIPFDRYYMNEELAPLAEDAYREYAREENVYVDVRVLDGKALIEEVYIRNKPIVKFLREDFPKEKREKPE